jgi:C4-dicarboxylate-specific signal transduction histidine kinase
MESCNIVIFFSLIVVAFIYRYYIIKKTDRYFQEKMDKELAKSREKDKINFHQNKLTSMGEMLENIAHQCRQPLSQKNSGVSIIDDILYQNGSKDAKVEQKLSEIESLTTYMSKTIDDFKNLFDKKRSKEPFSLRDVIEKSIYILKGTLDSHNIEIDIDLDDDFKSYGYPSELQQVIVAILNNAKEALINKKMFYPEIYIRVDRIDEYNNIYICDNAGGIDVDIIDKIFEPYFTTKYKSKGTGLGL